MLDVDGVGTITEVGAVEINGVETTTEVGMVEVKGVETTSEGVVELEDVETDPDDGVPGEGMVEVEVELPAAGLVVLLATVASVDEIDAVGAPVEVIVVAAVANTIWGAEAPVTMMAASERFSAPAFTMPILPFSLH